MAYGYVKDHYQNISILESICNIVCELILILIILNHSNLSDVRLCAHVKIVILQLMFKGFCPLVYNFGITNTVPVCHFCPALIHMFNTIYYG